MNLDISQNQGQGLFVMCGYCPQWGTDLQPVYAVYDDLIKYSEQHRAVLAHNKEGKVI